MFCLMFDLCDADEQMIKIHETRFLRRGIDGINTVPGVAICAPLSGTLDREAAIAGRMRPT